MLRDPSAEAQKVTSLTPGKSRILKAVQRNSNFEFDSFLEVVDNPRV